MLIGRKRELSVLRQALQSDQSAFVAVTGRRRVGKTFLIEEAFNYHFTFQHAGLANAQTADQLQAWQSSLRDFGLSGAVRPKSWIEAFDQLKEVVRQSADVKKVIFIDEMPWMDTPRSKFVMALEHFWNGWASARRDVVLIVCGSATSWIVNKVFRDHGGLYGRVTHRISISPFTLAECAQYAQSRGMVMTPMQVLQTYMVLGGIPYYWSMLVKGLSVGQNIDLLFFARQAPLKHEFGNLYASLFSNPEAYIKVVTALGTKRMGMTRNELIAAGEGLADNGQLSTVLNDLEYCGFISRNNMLGQRNNAIFQLTDNFTLFYFKYVASNKNNDENYWTNNLNTPQHNAWAGLAFEQVCFAHVPQIKEALGIGGVSTNVCSWQHRGDKEMPEAQIDMLIDRADGIINVCEIKYSQAPYVITADYDIKLRSKLQTFRAAEHTSKALHLTMVTTLGLSDNAYAADVQSQVTLSDLMHPVR